LGKSIESSGKRGPDLSYLQIFDPEAAAKFSIFLNYIRNSSPFLVMEEVVLSISLE
jgi:hypothetical protein